jgi:hypothetical protein
MVTLLGTVAHVCPYGYSRVMTQKFEPIEEAYPGHTCVDQPNLPCPACLKWTGNAFATVKQLDKQQEPEE